MTNTTYKRTEQLWAQKWHQPPPFIFMVHIEKQLLAISPHKPLIWKRFIDDIFSVWTLPEAEINNFVEFANSFHTTIKFTHEMSSKKIVFLDPEVFKGPRFITDKILDVQTHFSRPHKLMALNIIVFTQRYIYLSIYLSIQPT